ncbi:MAG: ATP-grasp domain-containing protein, partial [Thermodesulfobacteriota bacterium]
MIKNRPKVLVLDGMWNKTLAVVRSLGKRGVYVAVGEWTRFATALFSRYCSKRVIYPSPISYQDRFIEWLIKEVKTNRYDMILPTELGTQLLIVKNRREIERYSRVPFADYGLISNVQDKAWLMRHAGSHNYPCPKTIFFDSLDMVEDKKDKIEYPVVIKPRISSGSRGIVYVNKSSDLVGAYLKVHKKYPYPLIQKFIPNGGAYGVGALFNLNSEPRASFVYKRLREYPLTGGPSTLRISVENEKIKETALSLLKSLGWTGVAMVEFRVDSRDGRPKLMEINPRFWG